MKTLGTLLLGLISALTVSVLVNVLGDAILGSAHLGIYTDPLYVLVSMGVLTVLLLKKYWTLAAAFVVGAVCFFTPITIIILITFGCAIGQCPIL
jgi:hypothetical protein